MDSDEYRTYCKSLGVEVKESTIHNAGLGLFLVAPRSAGDARVLPDQTTIVPELSVPYFGVYKTSVRTDRCILIQAAQRDAEAIHIHGDPTCPATFANDPLVCMILAK